MDVLVFELFRGSLSSCVFDIEPDLVPRLVVWRRLSRVVGVLFHSRLGKAYLLLAELGPFLSLFCEQLCPSSFSPLVAAYRWERLVDLSIKRI
jgi:hypothetical protein